MANLAKQPKSSTLSLRKSREHKKTSRAFIRRVQNFIHRHDLLPKGSRILICVSGGPDSIALLFFFLALQKKYQWELFVAHVNYSLRPSAKKEAGFVKKIAEENNLPFFLYNSKKLSQKPSEDQLRTLRYRFFDQVVREEQLDVIALAHHQNDQAETLLLRLLRGSGLTGLSSMLPKNGLYIRPFLETPKEDILQFLKEERLTFFLDESNLKNIYTRNKVRNQLLPLLEKEYNPQIVSTLAETASLLQEELQGDELLLQLLLPSLKEKSDSFSFKKGEWQLLPETLQKKCLRLLFRKKGLYPPTKNLTESLQESLKKTSAKPLKKDFPRLKLEAKNATIQVHFKEID